MTARILRTPVGSDAEALFPFIFRTEVTRTLLWDGPPSKEDYLERWPHIVEAVSRGARHFFTIVDPSSRRAVGSCDIVPDDVRLRGRIGLWIAEPFHGQGLGTWVVRELVEYGFGPLKLSKLDALVFVGNEPSRRIFEKNGFELEGTIRCACLKRGQAVDEWHFGLVNPTARATRR